ncbi:amidohydrolase family protein [Paenibacillus filicis]|uniref:Amidohydrolase family protein n=2 Tax=Paenibacillus gyeongsangnamensis TaxID=3388067 RepID=A0ABT4Q5K8_9BACL|nr:amidohydrolase family protein [Paenibacillus filicis]MCZ8511960.1 amidohydrolase family protein [Paenibacillus filicis]
MRIDAHQHFWVRERGDYDWISPEMKPIYRDFLPEDLLPELERNGFDKSIVVQAAPTVRDTEFMLELSERTDRIAGVVGWLDLQSPGYKKDYERFRKHRAFVGIRLMIQEMPDAREALQPAIVEALRFLASEDLPVDLLMRSHQLPETLELLKAIPGLRGVIDHIAKPDIAHDQWEPWRTQMEEIASQGNIYCKLSGMVTEADPQRLEPDVFARYVRHIASVFGTERIMFGSDWPVCLLAAGYDEVVRIVEETLPEVSDPAVRANIFGLNAARFYKLEHLL